MKKTLTPDQLERQENARYNFLYTALTLLALSSIIAPYTYAFARPAIREAWIPATILPVVCLFIGYGLQAFFGRLTHCRKTEDNQAFESTDEFFQLPHAILPILIAATITCISYPVVYRIMMYRAQVGIDLYLDKFTLIPLIYMVTIGFSLMLGIVVWFFPFTRVISTKNFLPLCSLFFINMVFGSALLGMPSTYYLTASFVVYVLCGFTLLNQGNMLKIFSSARNIKVTASSRKFNFAVNGVAMTTMGIILVLVLSVCVGFSVIGRSILFFILRKMFNPESEDMEAHEIGESFSEFVFGGLVDEMDSSGFLGRLLFFVFFLIVIAVLLYALLLRRQKIWMEVKKFVIGFIRALMDLFMDIFQFFGDESSNRVFRIPDYLDEEIKMDKDVVRAFDPKLGRAVKYYRDYLDALELRTDYIEKMIFAYRTLVRCWIEHNTGVSMSDTPRQMRDKMMHSSEGKDVEELTEIFEVTRYSGRFAGEPKLKMAVETMSRHIKRYLK